jgi:hypothetical protein
MVPNTVDAHSTSPPTAARLRAVGLDPADPRLGEQLNARLATLSTAARAYDGMTQGNVIPGRPASDALAGAAYLRSSLKRLPEAAQRALSGAVSTITPGSAIGPLGDHTIAGGADPRKLAISPHQTLLPTGLYEFTNQQQDLRAGPVQFPGFLKLTFDLPEPSQLPQIANLHLLVPACRINVDGTAYVDRLANLWDSGFSQPSATNALAEFARLDDQSGVLWTLQLGSTPRPGVLTITLGNYQVQLASTFVGPPIPESHSLTIGTDPPFYTQSNELNLGAKAFAFGLPTIKRLNNICPHNSCAPIHGYDVIGLNVPLGAGYGASARVVAAHSVLDLAGDSSPDNGYRGATVTTQPGGNRLETIVSWYLNPYESLQYEIQWVFDGPAGQRPVATMPLRGPCDS